MWLFVSSCGLCDTGGLCDSDQILVLACIASKDERDIHAFYEVLQTYAT